MSNDQTNVENYEFEPIKGYPMLNWKGKRPFRSTQYFPAQLKEVYGQEDDNGWINKIFWGDNLQVMSHLLKSFRGKIDFIYIDPPFDSKADYKIKVKCNNKFTTNDNIAFEEKQYTDLWNNDEYLQFIYERLILIKELLSDSGVVALHTGWQKSAHLRLIMDEVFGNYVNEIVWQKIRSSKAQSSSFGNVHDLIFIYAKSANYNFRKLYKDQSEEFKSKFDRIEEGSGRKYQLVSMVQAGQGPNRRFGDIELSPGPGRHWIWSQEKIDEGLMNGLIEFTSNGTPRKKQYLDENKGKPIDDIWNDIFPVNSQATENTGYPTQKPVSLLQRLIEAFTDEDDLVFDCFMGSGTTQATANQMNRRFIGNDINLGAIQTTTKRLVAQHASFEVFNVNNYDIFRNPVEAKELLIEALEIQPLGSNTIYDGEKDGFKVKIMPVNRIATKEDLNDLIQGFPYKQFEERKEANPNQPVEEIMLVCMGHEPGLGAILENESGYKMKVEVVDILRDKSDLTFKYDSEASIEIKDGKLVIEEFYPRNLLQKLSQQKDDVTEWREMVESIMIDWNYDGAVMEPIVIDIPEKDEFVAGEYEIPEDANNIKIKITDLLSESYEEVIVHG
ncbi:MULTISPECIES: site-specific DNA-methyltransferase [Vibrio]|uniref:site-specific DNA-methyltransferase (adenine-specific) n=1 Tax=Vibrio alginolyticus TaxID=663 RepID=A0A1P8DP33_VIBAL|nr:MULTISPECIES: site-specific DNA-methyltransferase [Vibrio]APU90881.1 site-specific DNA-methyltransferase [Vibrio alginolyticus]MDW1498356.1 site-specific DNA-methyltransferase [Vibrio sp. YT-19(2023)]